MNTNEILLSDLFSNIPNSFDRADVHYQQQVKQALDDLDRIARVAKLQKQQLMIQEFKNGYQHPEKIY